MKNLYAPWRSEYIKKDALNQTSCVFCDHNTEKNDAHVLIIKRYKNCFVMMNRYPYNAGHLLVIPYTHTKNLHQLKHEQLHEYIYAISESCRIVTAVLNPEGCNVGMNIGKVAGASIPDHLHTHIIPRWQGDTNFLPLIGKVKQISFDIQKIYTQLHEAFLKEK